MLYVNHLSHLVNVPFFKGTSEAEGFVFLIKIGTRAVFQQNSLF